MIYLTVRGKLFFYRFFIYTKYASFELARSVLDIDVQAEEMDILDLSPNSVGTFDVVLLLGFYHLLDPIAVLQQIATLTREVLIVETTPTLWR